MKCPLFFREVEEVDFENRATFQDCLKEECAWWQPLRQHCVISGIEERLVILDTHLKEIRDNTPPVARE